MAQWPEPPKPYMSPRRRAKRRRVWAIAGAAAAGLLVAVALWQNAPPLQWWGDEPHELSTGSQAPGWGPAPFSVSIGGAKGTVPFSWRPATKIGTVPDWEPNHDVPKPEPGNQIVAGSDVPDPELGSEIVIEEVDQSTAPSAMLPGGLRLQMLLARDQAMWQTKEDELLSRTLAQRVIEPEGDLEELVQPLLANRAEYERRLLERLGTLAGQWKLAAIELLSCIGSEASLPIMLHLSLLPTTHAAAVRARSELPTRERWRGWPLRKPIPACKTRSSRRCNRGEMSKHYFLHSLFQENDYGQSLDQSCSSHRACRNRGFGSRVEKGPEAAGTVPTATTTTEAQTPAVGQAPTRAGVPARTRLGATGGGMNRVDAGGGDRIGGATAATAREPTAAAPATPWLVTVTKSGTPETFAWFTT